MPVHKMLDHGEKTACGKNFYKEPIEATTDWNEVTCRKCKRKNEHLNRMRV